MAIEMLSGRIPAIAVLRAHVVDVQAEPVAVPEPGLEHFGAVRRRQHDVGDARGSRLRELVGDERHTCHRQHGFGGVHGERSQASSHASDQQDRLHLALLRLRLRQA